MSFKLSQAQLLYEKTLFLGLLWVNESVFGVSGKSASF